MSLAAAALQIATVKALDGAISATVFDSMVDPLQLKDEPLPVAVVCAVQGHRTIQGRAILEATHTVDLVIDLGVARKVTRQVTDGEATVSVEFPDTDAGHDIVLHTLGYEIVSRLAGSADPWPELWRSLTARASVEPSIWERGASAENGSRLAIIRHVLRFEVMDDPVAGADLPPLWSRLLDAMDADQELQTIARLWRNIITTPAIPVWRQAQSELGLTAFGVRHGTGIAPLYDTVTDPAPIATEISGNFDDEPALITGDPSQATIAENGGEPVTIAEPSP